MQLPRSARWFALAWLAMVAPGCGGDGDGGAPTAEAEQEQGQDPLQEQGQEHEQEHEHEQEQDQEQAQPQEEGREQAHQQDAGREPPLNPPDAETRSDAGPIPESCGDGIADSDELCDDGNRANDDGCSSVCQVEPGYDCSGGPCLAASCGDGFRAGDEQCDDGDHRSGDGCSSVCRLEPGYDCSGGPCLAASCGDGFRAGAERCDDGDHRSGDGCNVVCDVEDGWSCAGGAGCHRTLCGDGVIEGAELCDDGSRCSNGSRCVIHGTCSGIGDQQCRARGSDGCSASCTFEPGFWCPAPARACERAPCGDGVLQGDEQCDDGKHCSNGSVCDSDAVCGGRVGSCAARDDDGCSATCDLEPDFDCPDPGLPCSPAECGNGELEGLEACDDGDGQGNDGCSASCTVEALYRCRDEPSECKPILELVSIRRFDISQASPAGLNYEPDRRAFAGHHSQSSQDPIELCLDGTILDPTDSAFPNGTIFSPGQAPAALPVSCADNPDADPCYRLASRPVSAGTLVGSTYDPFTGHDLFITVRGQDTVLTETPRDFDPTTQDVADFQVDLSDLSSAADLTIGRDGDLYVADSDDVPSPNPGSAAPGMIKVFERRRDASREIIVPDCETTPEANCSSFAAAPNATREWSAAGSDVLKGLFTIPGENLLGVFNAEQGTVAYDGGDLGAAPATVVGPSEYFTSKSAETATDGAAFIVCPLDASEDCQLFARTCFDDAECADIAPGTSCKQDAAVPYCHSPGDARDDSFQVDRDATGAVDALPLDALANDSLSESACVDPNLTILSVCGDGVQQPYEAAMAGHCPDDGKPFGSPALTGGGVSYDAPDDGKCGFFDRFTYTVDLGGGVIDTATVRVLVACVCGDSVVDGHEQCDQGADNAPPGTRLGMGTPSPIDDVYARCSDRCLFNVHCGDGFIAYPEQCDDGNEMNGDGCTQFCTLESVCGNGGAPEGVEQCDDGNTHNGDTCNANCTSPSCGDGNVDVQDPRLETCDDGNVASGDGCSALCQVEMF